MFQGKSQISRMTSMLKLIEKKYTQTAKKLNSANLSRHLPERRVPLCARITIEINGRSLRGKAYNISPSGIFIFTGQQSMKKGDKVRLHIRPAGSTDCFQAVATVMRFGKHARHGLGYGLKF